MVSVSLNQNHAMLYNCAIVDDEQHAIDLLRDYINETEDLQVIKTFNDPLFALEDIKKEDLIDFLFLDINMVGMLGTELSLLLREKSRFIIYVSANLESDLLNIDDSCDSYIGKPISPQRFARVISNLLKEDAIAA